ncbi:MAG: ferrochelatase [Chthoniobacterales bacterium]
MKGVLLVNLGSPDSTSVRDVRCYLREFLMDSRVIDVPWLLRFLIVYGCILPFRPRHSARAYRSIWTPEGSPLVVTSRNVQHELQELLGIPVALGMRYQSPSIEGAILSLRAHGVDDLHVIPMFPQYAMASYESAVEHVRKIAGRGNPKMHLTIQPPFYAEPDYINALVASASKYLHEDYDHLLLTFHGLPERQLRKSDPTGCHCLATKSCCETPSLAHRTCYRAQCLATVRAFASAAHLPESKYSVSYQSRLGRQPWMQPFTDHELTRLGASGVKKLLVMCPAFVADCLETLEEIAVRGREIFQEAGGEELTLIPCLNTHPAWIDALSNMVDRQFGDLKKWDESTEEVVARRKRPRFPKKMPTGAEQRN